MIEKFHPKTLSPLYGFGGCMTDLLLISRKQQRDYFARGISGARSRRDHA